MLHKTNMHFILASVDQIILSIQKNGMFINV